MTSLARFVRLDLRSLRTSARTLLIPAVIIAVAAVLPTRSPYVVIPVAAALSVLIAPQYLFGNDERGRLDVLYTALGISRRGVVAGRYTTSLVLLIGLTALGLVLAGVLSPVVHVALQPAATVTLTAASLGLAGTLLALELPPYFALGATRARAVGFAVPALIVLVLLGTQQVVPHAVADMLTWARTATPGWIALAAAVLLAVAGTASTLIAARLYARRDL